MKYGREIKIGILLTVAVASGLWGINYLKGSEMFSSNVHVTVQYDNVSGLVESNGVLLNGYKIGQVYKRRFLPDNSGKIEVTLEMKKSIFVSDDAIATIINSDLLGGKAVQIDLGISKNPVQDKGVLRGALQPGLGDQIAPFRDKASNLMGSVDSLSHNLNVVFNRENQVAMAQSIKNLETITQNFTELSKSNGSLALALSNIKSITDNIKNQNQKIEEAIGNLNNLSKQLSEAKLSETVNNLEKTSGELNAVFSKAKQRRRNCRQITQR
ncbi:MAG: MCE family protein [Bacteroidetes bacterium]|nr:MCE family protein [Bacteroidota bacterium]